MRRQASAARTSHYLPYGCQWTSERRSGRGPGGEDRENVEALGLTGVTKIFRRDATKLGAAAKIAPFDLIFCDPPYGKDLAGPALLSCREGGWLAPDALIVVEEAADSAFVFPAGFAEEERRRYGETDIVIGRLVS